MPEAQKPTPRLVPLGFTLSSFLLIFYLLCIAFGLAVPEQFHMHEAWAPLLPGFEWLTISGFLLGAVEVFIYGWIVAAIYVPLHRFFHRAL